MEELFVNIPDAIKEQAKFVFEMAMRQKDIVHMVNVLNEYTTTCQNEEEKNFVEFYFNMKMEQLKNGNFHDKR